MQQLVRLLGDLGELYGVEHQYHNLRTPAEAVKLLCINKPELMKELAEAHEHGIGYRVIQAGVDLDYADLKLPIGSNDLILVPVVAGSGGGVGKILVGVALIAASIFIPGAAAIGFGLQFGAISLGVGSIGASLILGGVSQMLSPQPTLPNLSGAGRLGSPETTSTDGPQSITRGTSGRQSYAYTGASNTVGLGSTIPVAYGEVLIGSALLSTNIEVSDESDPLKNSIKTPSPGNVLIGGERIGFGATRAGGVLVSRAHGGGGGNVYNLINSIQAQRIRIGSINGSDGGSSSRHALVTLEVSDGLFQYVSGVGTTKVDGFFTYELELEAQVSGPDPVIAVARATVQGLMVPGQVYRWTQDVAYPKIEDIGDVRVYLRIIDADVYATQAIRVIRVFRP